MASKASEDTNCYPAAGRGCYGIRVVTGKMILAGTDYGAGEFVRLVGDKAASEKIYLTGSLSNIDRDKYTDLVVETRRNTSRQYWD